MKKVLLLGLLLFSALVASAQVAVKGVVIAGDDGLPMVGASVFEKGTLNGVVTELDGTYAITVRDENAVLVFSSVGFKTTEVPVKGRGAVIDMTLDVDSQLIDEVVVMGYSTKTRGEITSAVTTVSADKLKDVVSNNIGDMLQGKVAGVTVVKDSGRPGAEPSIRIRGASSLHASQEPLYVVDGIIGGSYDPDDVESVTVLKDAGATGMYGAQANGGVIVVTTKKAKTNKLQFNFKANVGLITPDFSRQQLMNTKQLYTYYREYFRDPETHLVDDPAFRTALPTSILDNDTDWRGLIMQNAMLQNYHFSVMGKNDWYSGYLSFSYYKEDGTIRNTDYTQVNVRSNNTINLTKWLTLTANLDVSANMADHPDDNLVYYVGENIPFDSPYGEDGNYRSFKSSKLYGRYDVNPMIGFESGKDVRNSKGFGTDLDFVVTARITPWLSFVSQSRASVGFWHSHNHRFADVEYMKAGDEIEDSMSYSYGGISTNMFKADKSFGKHSLAGLVGYEAQMTWSNDLTGYGQGLPFGLSVLDVASANKDARGNRSRSGMQSIISQINYNYDQRYFLTGSLRYDESSTFAPGNRGAIFPSLSAAWAINNEPFFQSSVITNLKLKASWGKTGMKDIGASKYLEAFAYSTQYDSNSAAVPIQMANRDLKWEETTQINAGVEVGITDRVSIDLNYYRNTTNNLLVYRDLPPTGGFSNQWQNLGSVLNTGFEAALNVTPVKTNDLRWDVDFSISYNTNKLFNFGEGVQFIQSNYRSLSQIYRDGVPMYTWYLREYAGVDPQTGREQFVAADGSLTYDYASARFVEAGTPNIPWQGGISTQVAWKNFKLSANGSFVWGNTLYGRSRASRLATFVSNSLMPSNEDKIWRQPGDEATIGLPAYALASVYHTGDLVKGNYFKLRNVTLSYTLPKSITKNTGITIALSCDNVFTATTVWGADPEVSMSADSGVAGMIESLDNRYPNKRQYNLQVNFTF